MSNFIKRNFPSKQSPFDAFEEYEDKDAAFWVITRKSGAALGFNPHSDGVMGGGREREGEAARMVGIV